MAICLFPVTSQGNLNSASFSYQGIWAAVSTWEQTHLCNKAHLWRTVCVRSSKKDPKSYLIVQVVDFQLIAPSAVGEVETVVFFGGEQLIVLELRKHKNSLRLNRLKSITACKSSKLVKM